MSGLVSHADTQCTQVIHPRRVFHQQLHRFVAQQVAGPSNGAVELFFRGGQAQRVDVVAHDFKHLNVAPHQQMLAVGLTRFKEQVARTDDHSFFHFGHVTILTLRGRCAIVGVGRVQPLVVRGLFHVVLTRGIAFHVRRLGHQRVATGADLRCVHVRSVANVVPGVGHHRGRMQRRVVLACPILPIDHGAVKVEHATESVADRGRLLVTSHAAHTVHRQCVVKQLRHGIVLLAEVVGIEVSERGVTRCALVLQFQLVVRVDGNFVDHLCAPKRILGAVGHEGTAPLVRRIDVVPLRSYARIPHGICTVTTCALSTAREQGVGRVRQVGIRRHERPAVVGLRLGMEVRRPSGPRGQHCNRGEAEAPQNFGRGRIHGSINKGRAFALHEREKKSQDAHLTDHGTSQVLVQAVHNVLLAVLKLFLQGATVKHAEQGSVFLEVQFAGAIFDRCPKHFTPRLSHFHLVEFALHTRHPKKVLDDFCKRTRTVLSTLVVGRISQDGASALFHASAIWGMTSPCCTSNTRTSAPVTANMSGMRPK